MTVASVLISVRAKKTKKLFASYLMSGYMGPTYVTRWVMRRAKASSLKAGEYEYQIGKKGAWQS